MKNNIPLEEAQSLLLNNALEMETEQIKLSDALDRVLSRDLKATEALPPFDRSPYDGYAFRGEDTKNATKEKPVELEIIEEVPAGYAPKKKVTKGKAVKILTGAPIPRGQML